MLQTDCFDATPHAESLLRHPKLWRAREIGAQRTANGQPTGYAALDALLCDGGWPRDGLTEILCDTHGVGELRLLAPALRDLSRSEARWVAWVNPPFVPYAPALESLGIDVGKVLLIHPRNHREALWSLEQALRTGTCSAALAWLNEADIELKDLRRLQHAAKTGGTWANLFRPAAAADQPSLAELRLTVRSRPSARCDALSVSVLKRRGGWPVADLDLTLAHPVMRHAPQEVKDQLALWRRLLATSGARGEPAVRALAAHPEPQRPAPTVPLG